VRGIYAKVQLLCEHPRLGQRYEPIADREVRETSYGHYRLAYLIVQDTRIEVLGVFHARMDIERHLR
jgi:plasmid stabilization system protein ParE